MNGMLVLVRHGESEWNARNVWTGLTDIPLTDKGRKEAQEAARLLSDIRFDMAFTSLLSRAQETLSLMRTALKQEDIPVYMDAALNERDYGVYTGKNKLQIKEELGDADFLKLRRGWDYPVKDGESLKQVYARVTPYFDSHILPELTAGKHVLVVAHGNSLRALIKKLDDISDEEIPMVELATGEAVVYEFDAKGTVIERSRRK